MRRSIVLSLALGVACISAARVTAAGKTPLSGPAFDHQLAARVTAKWANVSFRQVVESLAAAQTIAIVIDRRIDADAPFELSVSGDSLELSLARIAERKETGYAILRPVVYFGPKPSAERLPTLAALKREEIARLPASARRTMQQSRPGGWPMLAEPKKLVEQLAAEAHVKLENAAAIPHDLWPEVLLPSMIWSDRLTLILAQFDLTFAVNPNGQTITLTAIPAEVTLTRKYAGGDSPRTRQTKLRSLVPDATVELEGDQLVIRGRLEDHQQIAALLAGKPVRTQTVTRGQQRYQLNVAGLPLENVLAQLGKMLKLEIKYDRAAIEKADISLKQLISFDVADATLDELLSAAVQGTGLTFDLTGAAITIRPAKGK